MVNVIETILQTHEIGGFNGKMYIFFWDHGCPMDILLDLGSEGPHQI